MFTKDQVNQLKELLAQQRKEIQGDIQKEIKASEERVTKTIKTEVADLSEIINKLVDGHEDHRLRIEELEESVGVTVKH